MQSDGSDYSSVPSNSPRIMKLQEDKEMITTKQLNRIQTEHSMGTVKDSTIQPSEMGITNDFVFKENSEHVKRSSTETDNLLHKLSKLN